MQLYLQRHSVTKKMGIGYSIMGGKMVARFQIMSPLVLEKDTLVIRSGETRCTNIRLDTFCMFKSLFMIYLVS